MRARAPLLCIPTVFHCQSLPPRGGPLRDSCRIGVPHVRGCGIGEGGALFSFFFLFFGRVELGCDGRAYTGVVLFCCGWSCGQRFWPLPWVSLYVPSMLQPLSNRCSALLPLLHLICWPILLLLLGLLSLLPGVIVNCVHVTCCLQCCTICLPIDH